LGEQEADDDRVAISVEAGHHRPVDAADAPAVEVPWPDRDVWDSGLLGRTLAKMNSFHAVMKANTDVATSPGPTSPGPTSGGAVLAN
jgi:hypothetical protein